MPQPPTGEPISAAGKHVVVIGGGDTGADCVGNALREGAASIVQLELLPEPPEHRPDDRTPWPQWPLKYRLSYAMEEATDAGLGEQDYSITTTHFSGDERQRSPRCTSPRPKPAPPFEPVAGTERELPAQLVLLAMGFLGPEQPAARPARRRARPARQRQGGQPYTTSVDGVFAAGDARRGQSLIVWAINEGRQCARVADRFLAAARGERPANGVSGEADLGPEGPPLHVGPGVPSG